MRYRLTKPVKKFVAITRGGCHRRIVDPDDATGLQKAKREFDRIEEASFWLECDENIVEGLPFYALNSDPKKFSEGYSGFFNMEEAIEYFQHEVT